MLTTRSTGVRTMGTMATPQTPRHQRGRAALVVVGWLLAVVAVVAFAWVVAPDYNAGGQCEGLGFGCTLTPRDMVGFAALLGTPIALGTLLGGLGVVAAVGSTAWGRRLSALALGTLATVVGVLLTLGVGAVLLGLR